MSYVLTDKIIYQQNIAALGKPVIGAPALYMPDTSVGDNPIENDTKIDGINKELLEKPIIPGSTGTLYNPHVMMGSTEPQFEEDETVTFSTKLFDKDHDSYYYTITGGTSKRTAVYTEKTIPKEKAEQLAKDAGHESVGAHWSAIVQAA